MTIAQKRKTLQRIVDLEHDIAELKRCRTEVAMSGYASASLTSSSGSKSYTRLSIGQISEAISAMQDELRDLRQLLSGVNPLAPKYIMTIWN